MLFVLAKFDVRVGNQVVWVSDSTQASSLPGIEFKMLPSGLHSRQKETIFFVCGNWNCIARYEARYNANQPDQREDAQMYSLAALTPVSEGIPWNQESYLKIELGKFLDSAGDFSVLPSQPYNRPDPRAHPILSTFQFMKVYGPMIFELWKAGLLRSRTILAAVPGQSIRSMCHFTYIASQLSTIPSDVAHLLPGHKPPIQALYNVSISDLQRLQSAESFWATTTDTVLLSPSRDACDGYAEQHGFHDHASGPPYPVITSTWRDRRRFGLFADALGLSGLPVPGGFMESVVDSTANGLIWWASAGESSILDREEAAPLLGSHSASAVSGFDVMSEGVALIGQFQEYTRQLVKVFARIAQDDDNFIRIGIHDIAVMGLDPFAKSDREFLQRFSLTWWDRPVVFKNTFCCCC